MTAAAAEARLEDILAAWEYGGGDLDDRSAIAALRELIADFDTDPDPETAQVVLAAARQAAELLAEHGHDQEAAELTDARWRRHRDTADPDLLIALAGVRLDQVGDWPSAEQEAARRDVVARLERLAGTVPAPSAVILLGAAADVLRRAGDVERAAAAYSMIIEQHADPDPVVRRQVARAARQLGQLHAVAGDLESARRLWAAGAARIRADDEESLRHEAYELLALIMRNAPDGPPSPVADLTARFGSDPQELLRRQTAAAAYALAVEQRQRDALDAAEATYRCLITAFADDHDLVVRQRVASAMLNLGYLRMELQGRLDEAREIYDDLLRRFDSATGPELRETLARAAASRNKCLNLISRRDGAVTGTGYPDYPQAERQVDLDAVDEADELLDRGEHGLALAVLKPAVARLVGSAHPERRRLAVRALYRRGLALTGLGRDADAVITYAQAVNLYGFDLSTDMELEVSRCLAKQAPALDRLGRHAEEADVYRMIMDRWSASQLPELHERVAWSCWCLAITLAEEDAIQGIAAYRDTIDRFRRDAAVGARRRAATAAYNLVLLLKRTASRAEAVEAGAAHVPWLVADEDAEIRQQGRKVQLAIARVLDPSTQRTAKLAAYRELAALPTGELTADQRTAVLTEFGALGPLPLKDVLTFFRRGMFRRR